MSWLYIYTLGTGADKLILMCIHVGMRLNWCFPLMGWSAAQLALWLHRENTRVRLLVEDERQRTGTEITFRISVKG